MFRRDDTVRNGVGQVGVGAFVYYCNQPCNVTTASIGSTTVPSNLAAVYTDSTGSTNAANPQSSNNFGQTAAYLAYGTYTVAYLVNGVVQNVYADQLIGQASATGNSPVVLNVQSFGTGVGAAKGVRLSASITSGQFTLTLNAGTQYTFALSDVGKNIKVAGAGSGAADLYTTIKTFNSATSVTLNVIAGTTVSSVTAVWWTAGQDITDRTALNAALVTASSMQGNVYCPAAYYLYDTTPTWSTTHFKRLYGDGIRETFWCASNASAGSFVKYVSPPRWTAFGGTGQGFSIYGPGYVLPAVVSNVSLTSNVITATVSNGITLPVGTTVLLQLLSTTAAKVLNNQFLTVSSSSSVQFTAAYTHADIGSTADNGIAYVRESAFEFDAAAWECGIEEIEIYGFQGSGIHAITPILNNWKRIWVHNCGAFGYCVMVVPPTPVGATVHVMEGCYALGCYGPGFYGYYMQSSSLLSCAWEQCGGGAIFDSCEGITVTSPHVEQIQYRNVALPGKWLDIRGGRAMTIVSPFMILDSGGNIAQTPFDFNGTGTHLNTCIQTKIIRPIYFYQGSAFPTTFINMDNTTTWCSVDEPTVLGTGSSFILTDSGTNNSVVYQGQEQSQGMSAVDVTGTSGAGSVDLWVRGNTNPRYGLHNDGLYLSGDSTLALTDQNRIFASSAGIAVRINTLGNQLGVSYPGDTSSRLTLSTDGSGNPAYVLGTGGGSSDTFINRQGAASVGIGSGYTSTSGTLVLANLTCNTAVTGSPAATLGATTVTTLAISGNVGFYGHAITAKQTVTGSKGGNAALTSLMSALVAIGLFTDTTT